MTKSFLTALAALLFVLVSGLQAQTQEGAVAIADKIRPQEEATVLDSLTRCVAELKATGTKDKDARKSCLEMAKISAHTTERVANEAADATKASRPIMLFSRYGYGGYNVNQGSSYGDRGESALSRQQRMTEESRLRSERLTAESKAREEKRAEESKARQERFADEARARQERRAADTAAREAAKKKK